MHWEMDSFFFPPKFAVKIKIILFNLINLYALIYLLMISKIQILIWSTNSEDVESIKTTIF